MAGTTWFVFSAGKLAKGSEVNSNLDWIEGSIVPMNAGSTTTGVYDLGSAAARWQNLYLNNVLHFATFSIGEGTTTTIANLLSDHNKAAHDALAIDHGSLGGKDDDDHSAIYLNNTRHDTTTRHPVSVIKLSTGSYSEDIANASDGTAFTTNKYGHQIEVKGESTEIETTAYTYPVTTGWVALSYQMKNTHITIAQMAYAQWSYHAASQQAIWGIWDTVAKKLVCVLVEEDEGYCKLSPELKINQILVKFKNAEKFLKKGYDVSIDKTKDEEEKEEKIKEKAKAGYILENMKVSIDDIEEVS